MRKASKGAVKGESALIDCAAGEGRALVIASELNNRWNDFPLHPTFVAFVHEAVRYLGSARPHTTEYVVGDAPAGLPRTPGIATVADAPKTDRGTNANQRSATRRVAINVDPHEGDPGRISADEFQSAVTRLKDAGASQARVEATEQEDRQHLWRYAFVMMIAALVCEGIVASRTG